MPDERPPANERACIQKPNAWTPSDFCASADASEVKSPCIEVCLLEDGVCQGCFRSIREIASWSSATSELKRRILQECERRRDQAAQR